MVDTEKNRAARLRRVAAIHGYRLEKSRTRNPDRPEFGGFVVIDNETNGIVHGYGEAFQFTADLDSVERFLEE